MNKVVNWYNENYTEICWFIIGWLAMGCLDQLGKGFYVSALIDGLLAYANYYLWKVRQ